MRNLKRVLSLALASVMLLGMMVIGAGAADKTYADLTDSAQISNTEAVALLVDLGIIQGKPDGSYAPTEIVDRATMAKLICTMIMGDIDQNLYKGTKTDLTDVDGHWAEGYIKYCYSNNIITGDGQGHFFPNEPVTVVQAAKMLLVALGYNADDRGYQNDSNWSVNIMKDAQSTTEAVSATSSVNRSLTKGISVKATDSLTRDNAAQMIFNTLFVETVTPNYQWDMGTQYIQSYVKGASMAATTYNGLTRVTDTLKNVTVSNGVCTAVLAGGNKTMTADPSDIGTKVAYYTDGSSNLVSSTAVATGTATVLASSATGVQYSDLVDSTNAAKKYIGVQPDATVNYVLNGDYEDTTGSATQTAVSAGSVGTLVEFIDTDATGKYDLVKVTTYTLAKVNAVTAAKGDNEATVTINGLGTVTNLTSSNNVVPVSKIDGVTDLAKDDVILYNIVGDTTTANSVAKIVIAKPDTVTGKITAKASDNSTVTIDGTKYTASAVTATNAGLAKNPTNVTLASTMTAYLDAFGNVIGFNPVADAVSTDYAVVLTKEWVAPGMSNGFKGNLAVLLLLADGTQAQYSVATVGGTAVSTGSELAANDVISYTVNSDGNLVATKLTAAATSTDDSATTITKGTATISVVTGPSSSTTAYANDETVFFYYNGTVGTSGFKSSVYVGKDNVPTYSSSTANNVVMYTDGGTPAAATVVIIKDTVAASGTGEYAYVLNGTKYEEVEGGKMYSVVINGEKTSLLLPTANTTLTSVTAGNLYEIVTMSDGTKAFADKNAYTATFKSGDVKVIGSDYVVVDGTGAGEYKLASDVVVYVSASTTVDGALSVGDTVSYLYSTNNGVNTITHIFITADT